MNTNLLEFSNCLLLSLTLFNIWENIQFLYTLNITKEVQQHKFPDFHLKLTQHS